MTAQPLFDGTFSSDSVAAAAHALVAQLHDEAMAAIAELAEHWAEPVQDDPVQIDSVAAEEPVVYREPATWSVVDDEADVHGPADADADAEDDAVRVVPLLALPALPPRLRPAGTNVTDRVESPPDGTMAGLLDAAETDEFAAPLQDDRESVAV